MDRHEDKKRLVTSKWVCAPTHSWCIFRKVNVKITEYLLWFSEYYITKLHFEVSFKVFCEQEEVCIQSTHGHVSMSRQTFLWLSRKYLWDKMVLLTLPPSDWPLFTQALPSFPAHPAELLLEMGLCYMAPGGLAAGAGGRQEQAPSAMDSSSALAESARERPELGMTPVSKVPHGFIHRPKLRFPSPLNFPALLFFLDLFFQPDQYIFQRGIAPPPSIPAPILTSSPNTSSTTPPQTLLKTVTFFTPLVLHKKAKSL